MSIPNCPYCGKKMIIERVDFGGGRCEYMPIHEPEDEHGGFEFVDDGCGYEFAESFRTKKEAEIAYKVAVYCMEGRYGMETD